MKRPCLTCGNLIAAGSRCRRCAKAREVARRGTSSDQRRFRHATLERSSGRCIRCGSRDRVEAHHAPAIAAGGDPDKPGEALCDRCHRQAHR